MKIFDLFFLFFLFLVGTLAIINSDFVYASCSIGASPLEMSAKARPGQTVEVAWNLFNLGGDRPSHVLVTKSSGPDWSIAYIPRAENKSYDISGISQSIFENFAIDKSPIVSAKPVSGVYVVHPNASLGYIVVENIMKIRITLPEDADIGEQQNFIFTALARCFGESGAVTASVATELKVHITPSTDYYESAVDSRNVGRKIIDFFSSRSTSPGVVIGGGFTLILTIVFIVLVVMARKKLKKLRKRGK